MLAREHYRLFKCTFAGQTWCDNYKCTHLFDYLGLGSRIIMTTINVHLRVKHGVTRINARALHGQSSLSQPWSQWPQYNESSNGVTFTILNRYLQVISSLSLSN